MASSEPKDKEQTHDYGLKKHFENHCVATSLKRTSISDFIHEGTDSYWGIATNLTETKSSLFDFFHFRLVGYGRISPAPLSLSEPLGVGAKTKQHPLPYPPSEAQAKL